MDVPPSVLGFDGGASIVIAVKMPRSHENHVQNAWVIVRYAVWVHTFFWQNLALYGVLYGRGRKLSFHNFQTQASYDSGPIKDPRQPSGPCTCFLRGMQGHWILLDSYGLSQASYMLLVGSVQLVRLIVWVFPSLFVIRHGPVWCPYVHITKPVGYTYRLLRPCDQNIRTPPFLPPPPPPPPVYSAGKGKKKKTLFIFLHNQLPFFLPEIVENFSRKSFIFSRKYLYFPLKF